MRVLIINKFLHPNGGAETYIFKLGACLEKRGHEVQYFGMDHSDRIAGNRINAYTEEMDFHGTSMREKLCYSLKTIYSAEARAKLRLVLDNFSPDVCHLNNFNYQLTPSILLEIRKWEKQTGHQCRIVYTAHDYQLVCPNHMCRNPQSQQNCEKCLGGHFRNCAAGRCIHGSLMKSLVGMVEAMLWNRLGVYKQIDTVICCSHFMKARLDTTPILAEKTVVLHNFADFGMGMETEKKDYVLYFGRYSREKGIATLTEAAKQLPQIPFVFAGSGPMEEILSDIPNIYNAGFQSGEALANLIRRARFTVYPSEWYENCPLSVIESQSYGTPVLGADIGGIPELIREGETGELFESGNTQQLKDKIFALWRDKKRSERYAQNCRNLMFHTPETYLNKLMAFYTSGSERIETTS